MLRTLMTSKIHRATVTQADLHYVGSVTIDPALTEAAGLVENEQVTIVDITNGHRLVTYMIEGERDSGVIGINGGQVRRQLRLVAGRPAGRDRGLLPPPARGPRG